MNESEQRRKKLLLEARNLYQDNETFPAVHPRYRLMSELTSEHPEHAAKGSFKLRSLISLLCFLCYLFMKYGKITIRHIDSGMIHTQIEKEMNLAQISELLEGL